MSKELLTLEEIVARTPELPSIPAAALKVIQETESVTATAASVARILVSDQALTARILRLANSAYYGLTRKVNHVSEAVVVLGMRTVKNLALVASSYPWLTKPVPGYELGSKDLWLHSIGVGIGAQLTAKLSRKCHDDMAFTAGLLCDIGKLAMSVWFEEKTSKMLLAAQQKGMTFCEVERLLLGYDHAEVGAFLTENWNFPTQIVQAIRYHHSPDQQETYDPLADCVHVGDYLTMMMGFGLGGDGLQYKLDPDSLSRLGLEANNLDEIINEFVLAYEAQALMFEELQAA